MLEYWHVFLAPLIITIKFCFADIDNLQDFCPTDIQTTNDHYHLAFPNAFPCKNSNNITASDFKTSKLKQAGSTAHFLRSSTNIVTAAEFSGLNTLGLALARTDLDLDGLVSLHSHPRAAEIMFVSKGVVTVGFVDTSSRVFKKVLKDGDVFIVPIAMRHFCINTGNVPVTILSVHNSQNPGLIDTSGTLRGAGSDDLTNVKQTLASVSQTEVD